MHDVVGLILVALLATGGMGCAPGGGDLKQSHQLADVLRPLLGAERRRPRLLVRGKAELSARPAGGVALLNVTEAELSTAELGLTLGTLEPSFRCLPFVDLLVAVGRRGGGVGEVVCRSGRLADGRGCGGHVPGGTSKELLEWVGEGSASGEAGEALE